MVLKVKTEILCTVSSFYGALESFCQQYFKLRILGKAKLMYLNVNVVQFLAKLTQW